MIAEVLSPIMVELALYGCGDLTLVHVAVGIPQAAMSRDWGVGSRQDEGPGRAS